MNTSHTERGEICSLRSLHQGQTHCTHLAPHSPESCDPTSPELRNLTRDRRTWKNFILPVRWSGEFFLFVRTTGRIIIPIIIEAVIGVLRVVKHRPAPCSAPVEWERWSDVSQSLDSLLPSSLPSVCLIPSLPPPHTPSPPCTHTLRDGVGIVFAILASQTARLFGYYYFLGGGGCSRCCWCCPQRGGTGRLLGGLLVNLGWPFEPGCAAPVATLGSLGGPGCRGASAPPPPHPRRDKGKRHDVNKSCFKVSTWKLNFESGVQLPTAPRVLPSPCFSPQRGRVAFLFIYF